MTSKGVIDTIIEEPDKDHVSVNETVKKAWTHIAAFGLGVIAVFLVYMDGFTRVYKIFNPDEPAAKVSDVERIADERYVAGRGSENQINNSLRLMESLPDGYKRTALELVNTGDFDDALTEYREGFAKETNNSISDQEIWGDLKKIAATISPRLELACREASIRGRKMKPNERVSYSFELKIVGRFSDALIQATRALNEVDENSQFDLYHRALSAQNHALFELGRYDEALQGYERAYSELRNRQDSKANKNSYATAISGLGLMAHKYGDYGKAIKFLNEEAIIWLQQGHYGNYANAMSNLGRSARLAGDRGLAESAYNSAITVSLITDSHETLFRSLSHINVIYDNAGLDDLSYKTSLFGAREARRIGLIEQEAVLLKDLVVTRSKTESSETVNTWIQRLEELADLDPSRHSFRELALSKAVYAYNQGRFTEARKGFEQLPSVSSSSTYNDAWRLSWLISIDNKIGDLAILCSRLSEFDASISKLIEHGTFDNSSRFSSVDHIRKTVSCEQPNNLK